MVMVSCGSSRTCTPCLGSRGGDEDGSSGCALTLHIPWLRCSSKALQPFLGIVFGWVVGAKSWQLGAIVGVLLCPEHGEVTGFQIQRQVREDADLHLPPVHLLASMSGTEHQRVPALTRKREVDVSRSHPRSAVVLVRDHIRKGHQQRAILGCRLAAQCPDQAKQERAIPPEGTAEQRKIVIVTPGLNSFTIFA